MTLLSRLHALKAPLLVGLCLWLLAATGQAKPFQTVVIDPGHGGRDNGADYARVYEKHLALDTALRVENILKLKGYKTRMTRRSDTFVSLKRRSQIGNSYSKSIFVSIHYNYTHHKKVSGLETFYCGKAGRSLAQHVQSHMLRKVKARNRGVKYARFSVLRRTKAPAVLVECGFVSNTTERNRMKQAWYRQAVAQGIANGIIAYGKSRY